MFNLFKIFQKIFGGQVQAAQTATHTPRHNLKSHGHPSVPQRGTQHATKVVYGADRIGIVGFHDDGFVIARPIEAHAPWLQERALTLHQRVAGNGTNITAGLRQGIRLLEKTPPGILRRLWLLTDGYPNRQIEQLYQVVDEAYRARINVNTIGFGDDFDKVLLKRISSATHNGKFITINSLRQLTDALTKAGDRSSGRSRHRAEYTVLAIDLSGSMMGSMAGERKIDVVQTALLQLLKYKQVCFS